MLCVVRKRAAGGCSSLSIDSLGMERGAVEKWRKHVYIKFTSRHCSHVQVNQEPVRYSEVVIADNAEEGKTNKWHNFRFHLVLRRTSRHRLFLLLSSQVLSWFVLSVLIWSVMVSAADKMSLSSSSSCFTFFFLLLLFSNSQIRLIVPTSQLWFYCRSFHFFFGFHTSNKSAHQIDLLLLIIFFILVVLEDYKWI